ASGTARTEYPDTGDGPETTEHALHRPPAPVPAARSSGSRPATSRTPPAPPRRPGSARSLTCLAARPRNGSYRETGDASHARPDKPKTPPEATLTRLRSFRDDRR